jgi:hypothetical protein
LHIVGVSAPPHALTLAELVQASGSLVEANPHPAAAPRKNGRYVRCQAATASSRNRAGRHNTLLAITLEAHDRSSRRRLVEEDRCAPVDPDRLTRFKSLLSHVLSHRQSPSHTVLR